MKENFERIDSTQLVGCVYPPNGAIIRPVFFEILLDPFLLIGLNESFIDILRAEIRNYARMLLEGMTKTCEMEEFQDYNYFATSIEAILQRLNKDFNKSPRKDTI
ncbi:14014_t:CDS:2 [Cetraspora pellucida]|uniref:14014_t:CDS:1 n=1 Tax=Cetraspora pellucida TaxID=1433469 RepID=A0A9N8W049_9GLOM|nr:14014_t:CDS:2 [Cetraspora pellucida]